MHRRETVNHNYTINKEVIHMTISKGLKESGRKRELFMLYFIRILCLFALFLAIVGVFHDMEVENAKDHIRDGYQIRVEGKLLTDELDLQMFASEIKRYTKISIDEDAKEVCFDALIPTEVVLVAGLICYCIVFGMSIQEIFESVKKKKKTSE